MQSRQTKENPEENVLNNALYALGRGAGIEGRVLRAEEPGGRQGYAQAIVDLAAGTRSARYAVECKTVVDRITTLALVKSHFADQPLPGLLVAPYLSPRMAEQSRAMEQQFIDTAGNAYLHADGLYVFVSGQRPVDAKASPSVRGTGNPTALRMIFALLCEPALVHAPYREIVAASGVALGAVGTVFKELAARGFLLASNEARQRRLYATHRLLDDWVANYPSVLRPKLHARRFQAADPAWWKNVDLASLGACWGGEVAADRMTGYLKPATQTLYVKPSAMRQAMSHLVSRYRLRPQPNGPVEILESFWEFPPGDSPRQDLAPPVLVYADLMATLDSRNIETANLIRQNDLSHVLGPR